MLKERGETLTSIKIREATFYDIPKSVKDKVTIKTPIDDRQYLMRDFSILDNNDYKIVFGEDISNR